MKIHLFLVMVAISLGFNVYGSDCKRVGLRMVDSSMNPFDRLPQNRSNPATLPEQLDVALIALAFQSQWVVNLEKDNEDLRTQNDRLQGQVAALCHSNSALRQDRDCSAREQEALRATIARLNADVDRLSSDCAFYSGKYTWHKNNGVKLSGNVKALQGENDRLLARLRALDAQSLAAAKTNDELLARLSALDAQCLVAAKTIEDLEDKSSFLDALSELMSFVGRQ